MNLSSKTGAGNLIAKENKTIVYLTIKFVENTLYFNINFQGFPLILFNPVLVQPSAHQSDIITTNSIARRILWHNNFQLQIVGQ